MFKKVLLTIIFIITVYSALNYFMSVPLIKKSVYEIEKSSTKTILDNIYKMIEMEYLSIEAYKNKTLEGYKQQLKNILTIVEAGFDYKYARYKRGLMTEQEAKNQALEEVNHFYYNNNDYVSVTDYNHTLIAHPDPRYRKINGYNIKNRQGDYFIRRYVKLAREDGEGFTTFWWASGKGQKKDFEKLLFIKDYPKWKFVFGANFYLEDVKSEVERRKNNMIQELRKMMGEIKIGKTGYFFIFDSELNMIIHPDQKLEGKNFASLKNPVSGQSIGKELITASKTSEGLHYYKWDSPENPGSYIYDKIAWTKYDKNFDWYISCSAYTDEFFKSSFLLQNNIIYLTLISIFIAVFIAIFFARMITTPVQKLLDMAVKVKNGDLTARSDITTQDEIGLLAEMINSMVDKIKLSMEALNETKNFAESIIHNAPIAIFTTEISGTINSENPAMEKLLGDYERKVIGTNVFELASYKNCGFDKSCKEVLENGAVISIENVLFTSSITGKNIIIDVSFGPIYQGDKITGLVGNYIDVEERYRAEQALKEAKNLAEELVVQRTKKLSDAYTQMKNELKMAKRIQETIIPKIFPDLKMLNLDGIYLPMDDLGGDYYDIFKLSDKKIGVVIVDVSGHGVSAALITIMAKMAFNSHSLKDINTAAIVNEVNKEMFKIIGELKDYLTAFYGIFDLETGIFEFTNAGHPPALLYKKNKKSIEELFVKGFYIGIIESAKYESSSINVEIGDKIIFFTDGITEARNNKDEMYGIERLKNSVLKNGDNNLKDFCGFLVNDVINFRQDHPFGDDIALFCIEYIRSPNEQEENSKKGIQNVYFKDGKLYDQLLDGSFTTENQL